MSFGLIRGTVMVEPHNTEWESAAQEKINELKDIFGGNLVDAQHIGSTSVKSIYAKPIVDIAMGVRSFETMMRYNEVLAQRGIRYKREDHPGQHLYVCGNEENTFQTHYIHAVIWDGEAWNNYINLRDYLNCHEEKAQQYSILKQTLAMRYPEDRMSYTSQKAAFITEILHCADQWRQQT